MYTEAKLEPLNKSELNISGGSCPSCHEYTASQGGFSDGFSQHQVVDFLRGIWDGFTE